MDGGASTVLSAINAAFTFAELIAKLNDVPAEARRFSTLIKRVRSDYNEALRLLPHRIVQLQFVANADEKAYIEGTVKSTQDALADIGVFVEKIRIQDENGKGSVSVAKRMEWLWRYRSKVDSSERVLDTSHKSLLGAVQRMQLWIHASSTLSLLSPSLQPQMPMGLPTYQEAVRDVGGDEEQLDEFLVARRRKTRIHKREKTVDAVSINVRSVDASPSVTTDELDAFPEMSPRTNGPIELSYLYDRPVQTPARDHAPSFVPTGYRAQYTAYDRDGTISPQSRLQPFPAFDERPRSMASMRSMMSLRSEYNQFSTSHGHAHRQSMPSRPMAHDPEIYRTYSERDTQSSFASAYIQQRPSSVTEDKRDLRRARLSLVSGGHGGSRLL